MMQASGLMVLLRELMPADLSKGPIYGLYSCGGGGGGGGDDDCYNFDYPPPSSWLHFGDGAGEKSAAAAAADDDDDTSASPGSSPKEKSFREFRSNAREAVDRGWAARILGQWTHLDYRQSVDATHSRSQVAFLACSNTTRTAPF